MHAPLELADIAADAVPSMTIACDEIAASVAGADALLLTGDCDLVTDGERSAAVANGDALMGLVTAMGCAGAVLVAPAASPSPLSTNCTISIAQRCTPVPR